MFQSFMRWSCMIAVVLLLSCNGAMAVDILDGTGAPDLSFGGFELWLDASDVDGDTIADNYADGTTITSWTDKLNNYVAENAGGATVDIASAVNSMPVVTLDQVVLTMPHYDSLNPGNDPWYVFAVGASYTEGDDDSVWIRQGNQYSMSEGWSVMGGMNGAIVRVGDGATRASQTSPYMSLGSFGLVTMSLSGVNGVDTPTINGALSGDSNLWFDGGAGPTTNVYSESVDGADSFYIGRGDAKSQLAEVLIYRGALTETQVADVEGYLRTKYAVSDPVTPVATDAIIDRTGNGYDGIARGDVTTVAASVGGLYEAYAFEESYIQSPNPGGAASVFSNAMTDGTLSGWVKFDVGFDETTGWGNGLFLGSTWNNGTIRIETYDGNNLRTVGRLSNGTRSDIAAGFAPSADEWYHVAYSFGVDTDDPSRSKTMLVVTDSEGNVSVFYGSEYDSTLTFDLTDLCIGGMSMVDGADRDSFLDGQMTDIRVYSEALSLEDIALLADADFMTNPPATNLLSQYYPENAVPEPGSLALILTAFVVLGIRRNRK